MSKGRGKKRGASSSTTRGTREKEIQIAGRERARERRFWGRKAESKMRKKEATEWGRARLCRITYSTSTTMSAAKKKLAFQEQSGVESRKGGGIGRMDESGEGKRKTQSAEGGKKLRTQKLPRR